MRRMPGKLTRRIRGLPRAWRELDVGLALLSTMRSMGWQRSIGGGPVDSTGRPVPWYAYAATAWLSRRVLPSDRIFEFGAGHSTLWYAQRAASVTAVDDDPGWVQRLQQDLPANATVALADDEGYVSALDSTDGEFDVIVVDGLRRNECAAVAAKRVSSGGLIVFDNSDRPEFGPGVAELIELGFKHVEFVDFAPGYSTLTCTSVFFTDGDRWLSAGQRDFLGW
jgi:precorrin-6B methylase 2